MNAPPPLQQQPEEKPINVSSTIMGLIGGFAIIPIIVGFIFALGAAVLSYRHFGSIGWAILDFFFPYFYYPYYALVLDKPQPSSPTGFQAIMGGAKKYFSKRS